MSDALRRLVASVMLVAAAASFAAPPHASAAGTCPDGAPAGAPVVAAAMDHGGCEHPGAGLCSAVLGCATAPPALQATAHAEIPPVAVILTRPAAAPHYADLCRPGPPTPPPNSV